MREPSGQPGSPELRSLSVPLALWTSFAGHLLALMAAVAGLLSPNTVIAAGFACSIVAVAALAELAPPDLRARRAVTALTIGHGVAAMSMLAGLAPGVPWAMPLAGFAGAAALGAACLATVGRGATGHRQPRPLTMAPRVAAIALVVQALLQRWVGSATGLSMPLRAAIFLSIASLGAAVLGSLSIIALRVRPRWACLADTSLG